MPDRSTHVGQAARNLKVLSYLEARLDDFPEWVATVAFYTALHVIDAIFAQDPAIRHGYDHDNRDRQLRKPKYRPFWHHYRRLRDASKIARYLGGGGREYQQFTDFMRPDEVRQKLCRSHLHKLLDMSRSFLPAAELDKLGLKPKVKPGRAGTGRRP